MNNDILISINKCKGLSIINNKLDKCEIITKNKYCDIHNHIYRFINTNSDTEYIIECSICCEEINMLENVPLECGHIFHINCLYKITKKECPLCKKSLTDKESLFYTSTNIDNTQENNIYNFLCRYKLYIIIVYVLIIAILIIIAYLT